MPFDFQMNRDQMIFYIFSSGERLLTNRALIA